jgi:hypothetical protein
MLAKESDFYSAILKRTSTKLDWAFLSELV